ncbi:MAG: hypothetical protein M1480_11075 [Bacteroidetes bacterium]|nr:hypothetical protein [Bacteroidota bacterium]
MREFIHIKTIMKQKIFLLLAVVLMLLNMSCQEDFNPKTDFKEQYILNCYVNLDYDYYDSTLIYATVSKLYNVDGFDPSKNKINPYVSGVKIYCSYNAGTYQLEQDTLKIRKDTLNPPSFKYDTIQVYYKSFLKYIFPSHTMSVTAVMPDGKVLSASIQLLEGLQLGFSYDFINFFKTRINRFLFGNAFTIRWGGYTNERLYLPKLTIPYEKDSSYSMYYQEVPCTYINRNGKYEPLFPSPTSKDSISYDYSAIDSTMAQITRVENFKNFVGTIVFQMVEMDAALSKYYESTHGSIDQHSISLDQSVYSNINGGIGIFGSRRIITKSWNLDPNYIMLFIP